MNVTLRKMKEADIQQVQQVAKKSWNATYEGIIPTDIQENFLNTAYSDERMRLRLKHSVFLVAEMEHKIVGFASFSQVNEHGKAELGAIYLLPEYQGNGVGSSLLKEGIKNLNGVQEICLSVEKENKIGVAFYESKGFTTVSEFDDHFNGHILKTVRMAVRV